MAIHWGGVKYQEPHYYNKQTPPLRQLSVTSSSSARAGASSPPPYMLDFVGLRSPGSCEWCPSAVSSYVDLSFCVVIVGIYHLCVLQSAPFSITLSEPEEENVCYRCPIQSWALCSVLISAAWPVVGLCAWHLRSTLLYGCDSSH